jgi:hypothetical protein
MWALDGWWWALPHPVIAANTGHEQSLGYVYVVPLAVVVGICLITVAQLIVKDLRA